MVAAGLFIILFGFTMLGHIWQGIHHRSGDAWMLILSAICHMLAYLSRYISIVYPINGEIYRIAYLLGVVAPLWTDVFCIVVLVRLVGMFMPGNRIFRVKGEVLILGFVLFDLM